MKIDPQLQELFRQSSQDHNPMHWDPSYAKRTPFAEPIVFGMLSVLKSLGAWAQKRPFQLSRLEATFHRPIYLEREYRVQFEEVSNSQVRAKWFRGERLQVQIRWDYKACDKSVWKSPSGSPGRWEALPWEGVLTSESLTPSDYAPNCEALYETLSALGIVANQIPASQLSLIFWASYFIGMHRPGKQALFSKCLFDFKKEPENSWEISFERLQSQYHPDHRYLSLKGECEQAGSFFLQAFARPTEVNIPKEELRSLFTEKRWFQNQNVLITGGGRGIGRAVAEAFSITGAKVLLNKRSPNEEIFTEEFYGDIGSPSTCQALASALQREGRKIDVLVLNAFPPIHSWEFREVGTQEWLEYVNEAIKLAVIPLREWVGSLNERAIIVHLSSHYLTDPQPQFSHYLAAKAAVEGCLSSLALEYAQYTFVNVRLPGVRTDQTNTPIAKGELLSQVEAACRVIQQVREARQSPGISKASSDRERVLSV